ncbi:MAG: hypothetical protein IT174_08750 [Acidobacteria bacterium]|nr:hypothetical protein [Acidobacteriota bacterium]
MRNAESGMRNAECGLDSAFRVPRSAFIARGFYALMLFGDAKKVVDEILTAMRN